MSEERVVELNLGILPEAAVSGAVLLQSEHSAVLVFNATSRLAEGRREPAGTAVVTFDGLAETRFGGPNDEGRPEHPLYGKGLRELGYAACEVLSSAWARDRAARNEATARRIWGEGFDRAYAGRSFALRHFMLLFHDSTFECLATDVGATLSAQPVNEVLAGCASAICRE